MSSLSPVATVVPEFAVSLSDMNQVASRWLEGDEVAQEKFVRICSGSGVGTRYFTHPYDRILQQNGLQNRAKHFEEAGTQMLVQALGQSLELAGCNPEEIGALVFSSCSVPVIPSIDAAAILKTPLSSHISRVPVFQHGCAGGVVGLSLGNKLSQLGKPVIVSAVELCSLVFQPENHSGAHLVGAAIFADGAAATVIDPRGDGVRIVDSHSELLPDTRHLMGYDLFDDGFHLRLDRALPSALVKAAPSIVGSFLEQNEKAPEDIDHWLFHPGGIKILDFLRDKFALAQDQCRWSYNTLKDFGNLSSATILYVLGSFLNEGCMQKGDSALIMGIGPGLTVELILLER